MDLMDLMTVGGDDEDDDDDEPDNKKKAIQGSRARSSFGTTRQVIEEDAFIFLQQLLISKIEVAFRLTLLADITQDEFTVLLDPIEI